MARWSEIRSRPETFFFWMTAVMIGVSLTTGTDIVRWPAIGIGGVALVLGVREWRRRRTT